MPLIKYFMFFSQRCYPHRRIAKEIYHLSIKLKLFLFSILISVGSLSFADDDGTWTYNINSDGSSITVTGTINDPASDLVIPEEIDGYSVSVIGDEAFNGKFLNSVDLPNTISEINYLAFGNNYLTTINLPSSLSHIGQWAFLRNRLTEISLPIGLTSVGNGAFDSNEITSVSLSETLTEIGQEAFARNKIDNIDFPNTLTKIGVSAFAGNNISAVTLPTSLLEIEQGIFDSNKLTTIVIPEGIKTIGHQAFYGNELTSINLSGSIQLIRSYAFDRNQITSVVFPESIVEIERNAFERNALTLVQFLGDRPYISEDTSFAGNEELVQINFCPTKTGWPGDMIQNAFLHASTPTWVSPTGKAVLCSPDPDANLDIDGNSQYDALTDGLVILRDMFGLTEGSLINSVIGSDATNVSATGIQEQIAKLGSGIDIDGNGDIDALTDGLIILRYLFGLEGDTLINGVVAEDATRTSAEDIEAHLAMLKPSL